VERGCQYLPDGFSLLHEREDVPSPFAVVMEVFQLCRAYGPLRPSIEGSTRVRECGYVRRRRRPHINIRRLPPSPFRGIKERESRGN